ncbi:hypothetical protein Tco_0411836 [Tanacetum coccineum]
MGDEHLNTIPEMEKSSVENLVLIPSEFKGISEDICDVSSCDYFDAECGLINSLLSRNNTITSPKMNFLPEEFVGELDFIDPILPGIDGDDFDEEEGEINNDIFQIKDEILREKLLNVNLLINKIELLNLIPSTPFVLEYPSSSPIPVVDSDFLVEEVDTFLVLEDSTPLGIESDLDSEGDIVFLDNLLNEDPIPEYERAIKRKSAPVGFAPQWIGWQNPNNNNGWLDEDDDEEPEEDEADEDDDEEPEEDEADEDNDEEMEEEEYEEIEDEEEEEIVAEEEAEIIYPYDEADLNNRPPPASDDESEFAYSVIPVIDAENRPVPPVIHFSSTYELSESSSARKILKDIYEVYPLGLVPPTIGIAESRIRKLNEQMRERAEVDERIVKKIDKSDLRIQMVGSDAMNLDGVVRECQADVSKVISMIESMSLELDKVRKESRRALELVEWEAGVREQYLSKLQIGGGFVETSTRSFLGPFLDDPYVQARNAAMADDDVEDDDVEDDDDMDDDAADPSDPQSFEPRGSPRDSQYYNYTNGMITYSLLFLCHDRIMPPKQMSQAAIAKLVTDEVAKALAADRATRITSEGWRTVVTLEMQVMQRGLEERHKRQGLYFLKFMKLWVPNSIPCKEGAIELCRWFEKIECTFGISECASRRNKVKFDDC